MSRRSTPERLDHARREATVARLTGEHLTRETAEAWVAAWERQAPRDGLGDGAAYWDAAWEWLTAQRRLRVRP